ncbi:MAG: adenosylcobinamide-GDP ribazoletransferase [Fibrobacteres bacterium]|jgi:adenosylcobinamide-GDP ribazoletransferase|nr:adenosylcobinamide-GDP ribazoletransferase [Fibrobacterota bacterium]
MSLPAALGYLTVLRTPGRRNFDLSRAVLWFPVVGLFIGGFLCLVWWGGVQFAPRTIASLLTVLAWTWITGGVHLDGLANSSEALLSWRSRSHMHEVLRTPHIGPLGMTAVFGVLAVKVVALDNLPVDRAAVALFCAPMMGRSSQLLATCLSPYAKESGVAISAFGGDRKWMRVIAAMAPMALLLQLGPERAAVAMVVWLVLFLAMSFRIRLLLGGMTGATLGAVTEIVEASVMVVATLDLPSWGKILH